MKEKIRKMNTFKLLGISVLILYIIITLIAGSVYVFNSLREDFAEKEQSKGREEVVKSIILQSNQCQPFILSQDELQAQLINVSCLEDEGVQPSITP